MRTWRVYKSANRPFPQVSEDDVIDYMIMETLVIKDVKEQEKQAKKDEINQWKKDPEALRQLASAPVMDLPKAEGEK